VLGVPAWMASRSAGARRAAVLQLRHVEHVALDQVVVEVTWRPSKVTASPETEMTAPLELRAVVGVGQL